MIRSLHKSELERVFYQRLNFNLESSLWKCVFKGSISFAKGLLGSNLAIQSSKHGDVLSVITTQNQYQVLNPVLTKLEGAYTINTLNISPQSTNLLTWKDKLFFPRLSPAKLKMIFKNPHLFRDIFWILYAERIISNVRGFIAKNEIKKVVLASDHGIIHSMLTVAIRELNVQSFYVQHGMVSNRFPPLEYDFFFAYGNKSISCYRKLNTNINCVPVGRVYTQSAEIEKKDNLKIGVSINLLDDFNKVILLLTDLKRLHPSKELIVRPHPRLGNIPELNVTIFSGALEDYFSEIEIHLAGDSSIHLDSIYFRTPTYYCDLLSVGNEIFRDYYGFVESGLVPLYTGTALSPRLKVNSLEIAKEYIYNISSRLAPESRIIEFLRND